MSLTPSPAPPPSPEPSARDQSDSLNAAIATTLGIQKDFICPRCGSRHFGTANPTARNEVPIIGCHDEFNRRCNWMGSWTDIPPPAFDTDGNAMLDLLAKLNERDDLDVTFGNGIGETYWCAIDGPGWPDAKRAFESADSLPLCVRDAAARALGLAAGGEGTKP